MDIQTLVVALIGGGLVGFVQFLITRHDSKADKNSELFQLIHKIDLKITTLEDKIDKVDANRAEDAAVESRVRMLHFADELYEGRRHSKDSFDQAIDDCTRYDKYCADHPEFRNNQTAITEEFIKKTYAERLEKHDFL